MSLSRGDILQLLFWIPIGISSLASIYLYQGSEANQVVDNNSSAAAAVVGNSATQNSGSCGSDYGYELVEDATITTTHGEPAKVLRYAFAEKGGYLDITIVRWAELLSGDTEYSQDCRQQFLDILANAPMDAYFFETKGGNYKDSQMERFEFVLVDSSSLYKFADAQQDPDTFSERFGKCRENDFQENIVGCVFFNPRGDSVLITPIQIDSSNTNIYGHLAAFVRRAPKDQVVQFWKGVMQTYLERLRSIEEQEDDAVWLSTDGSGVAWLHVRLDPRPKYYDYVPYAKDHEL